MSSGILIYVRKGNFAVIKTEEEYIINVLLPNYYPNSHLDVSKYFTLDISTLIDNREFEKLTELANHIRMDYEKFKKHEVPPVKIIGRKLLFN